MPLQSDLFRDDPALNACLERDSAHVTPGSRGEHVGKLQQALEILLPGLQLPDAEKAAGVYGQATAAAVLRYKTEHAPPIVNPAYQTRPDNIVGRMTIKALDDDLLAREAATPPDDGPPPSRPPDTSIRIVTLWMNAFIGADVKNADGSAYSFRLPRGPHAGQWAIPGPFNGKVLDFDDCYLTDQRGFDPSNRTASSRIHAEVAIDFTGQVPTLTTRAPLGATVDTVRVRVSTGDVLNTGRGLARGGFKPHSGFVSGSKRVVVLFEIAGSNPIAKRPSVKFVPNPAFPGGLVPVLMGPPTSGDPDTPVDPDIDMVGVFELDAAERRLSFHGKIDGFPFFEGYVSADDGPPRTVFQVPPEPGQTPASGLIGKANRPVDKEMGL